MAFQPNQLGQFNTYSPNVEVVIGPEASKDINYGVLQPGEGIIIASTAKTANYYVEKMTLEGYPHTPENNISTIVSSIKIEISEPIGFTFFDKYFASIFDLGWQQISDVIVYVSVSFNGWFESGAASPRAFKTTWKCRVTNITVDTESSGSKYTMEVKPITMESLDSINHIVDRSFTSEIKESFEDTISELERVYNQTGASRDPTARLGENDRIYEFRVGDNIQELSPKMPVNLQAGRTSIQLGPDGRATYVVNSGITISEMLTTLASNITDIITAINPRVDQNLRENINQPATADIMRYFAVNTEAGYTKFDPLKNRYVRVLRYTIDLVYRPEIENQAINELGRKDRANRYMELGLLKKRYDYLFTGSNTEVLDLKINFNSVYNQLVSTFNDQNPQSLAPNIDEETRNLETGLDIALSKVKNLTNIFSSISSIFTGGTVSVSERLMETMPGSGILSTILNYTYAPTVASEQARRGVNVPMDVRHGRSVAATAEVGARANNSSAEIRPIIPMVRIDIGVRGDPYWMGINSLTASSSDETADYLAGTQMFYLKFKLGEQHDEVTGLTANLGKVTFNGIYNVTKVVSIIDGGRFTQTLTAFLDVTTLGVEF